jgi:hypothetical protein
MRNNTTYSEKLESPLWQRKRLEVLQRDGWACLKCRSTNNTLHVHHKTYEYGKEPWDYPNENFETLCKFCHQKEHKPRPIAVLVGEIVEKPITVFTLIDQEIKVLQDKLKERIPDDLMMEILGDIVFLQKKKIELKK